VRGHLSPLKLNQMRDVPELEVIWISSPFVFGGGARIALEAIFSSESAVELSTGM